ncbi:MAG: hypothetical protein PVF58_10380 [Candidatus Methanofastidiosia archaeon]
MKKMLMLLLVVGILMIGAFSVTLDVSEEANYDSVEFSGETEIDGGATTEGGGGCGGGAGPAPG